MPDETPLEDVTSAPRKTSVGGEVVEEHSLPDLIEAERHQEAKTAAQGITGGVKFRKFRNGGTA